MGTPPPKQGLIAMNVNAIRELFPITKNFNFQNHAAVAPLSKPAAEGMQQYIHQLAETAGIRAGFYKHADRVRKAAAELINASPEEIAFVKNTTEGLGWV